MSIALVAHDGKKQDLVDFVMTHREVFAGHELFATRSTGHRLAVATGLAVQQLRSGPLGGDQQVGAMVATGRLDLVLFFRDPLVALAHADDVAALLRLCDVYDVPLATNAGTARLLTGALVVPRGRGPQGTFVVAQLPGIDLRARGDAVEPFASS